MTDQLKIFFSGSLAADWMSGWQRCETLRQMGHTVVPFCQNSVLTNAVAGRWQKLGGRSSFDEAVVAAFNEQWLRRILDCRPDVAWLEWPKLLRRETLREARKRLPDCRFVAFYDDNPFGARTNEIWQWQLFFDAVPDYDLHLIKRTEDICELRKRGAQRVELFVHGFFEPLFHPASTLSTFVDAISFVGTALDHRVPFVQRLIAQERMPLTVYGNRWNRSLFCFLHRPHFRPAVLGSAYVEVLQRSRISLGFVSSSNRDEYTMRSFEIPACGGFLLAERTPMHRELFGEGSEAEFFSSVEECADKARYYLRNETHRQRIAAAGRRRCVDSDYSLKRRLHDALMLLEEIFV